MQVTCDGAGSEMSNVGLDSIVSYPGHGEVNTLITLLAIVLA